MTRLIHVGALTGLVIFAAGMTEAAADTTLGEHALQQQQQQARPPAQTEAPPATNINTADAETLQKLPGIGPATAKSIIEFREQNGGFKKIEELMNVKGIGEKTFLKLKPLITIGPPKIGGR